MELWSFMECSVEYHPENHSFVKKNIGPARATKFLNLPFSFYQKVFLHPVDTFHKSQIARKIGRYWKLNGMEVQRIIP